MVKFQLDELLIWSPLLSRNLGYPILGDFEDSEQEPTVPFNIQQAAHPTGFSGFQLSEVSSSSRSTVAHSDSPTVFSHEPTPSTSDILTAFNR